MPMFDFLCSVCKTTTEKIVKTGVQSIECPNCGCAATKQVSAPGSLILKGYGFYSPTIERASDASD